MPPSVLLDLSRRPYWVPLKVQLSTSTLLTLPLVMLPMESPWPLPKVQPVTVMPLQALEPPICTTSPSLMKQFLMLTLVPRRSMPSVLGEGQGAVMERPWARMLVPLPRNWIWNLGEFCTVMPVTVALEQPVSSIMAGGRLSVPPLLKAVHQACPCPSMTPLPLMVILVKPEPKRKSVFWGKVPMAVIWSSPPAAIWKVILLLRVKGPLRKVPEGTTTVPPLPTALMAAWMAEALSALPVEALKGELVMVRVWAKRLEPLKRMKAKARKANFKSPAGL